MKARTSTRLSCDDGPVWRVVDDLVRDNPITLAELDAVEAFLMPLVHALFVDTPDAQSGKTSPNTTPIATPTHKRRNELLPEEI
jgi:hypothetical protein